MSELQFLSFRWTVHAESIELIFLAASLENNKSTQWTQIFFFFCRIFFKEKKMEMTDWHKSSELVYWVVTVYRLKLLGCDWRSFRTVRWCDCLPLLSLQTALSSKQCGKGKNHSTVFERCSPPGHSRSHSQSRRSALRLVVMLQGELSAQPDVLRRRWIDFYEASLCTLLQSAVSHAAGGAFLWGEGGGGLRAVPGFL